MKILYVTTIGITMRFFKSFIKTLIDEGHVIEIATNMTDGSLPDCYYEWGCTIHQIDCSRSPFHRGNGRAIKQIKDLVDSRKYDMVHCHTPIAAMCTRLACCKARKEGTRVLYTAHGFHFFKGAPLKNWLVYYPVEKFCAHFTDVLITINKEDYALARKRLRAKKSVYVPGVGIDLKKFDNSPVDKKEKRKTLGMPTEGCLLLSVGELNKNKNHETVIRAIADIPNVCYVIAGQGELDAYLQKLIDDLCLSDRVKLLGYRNDVAELCKAADVYVMPSFREGLSVALMEAMASGLPCMVSKIRGNTDLIDENGGVLFSPHSIDACRVALEALMCRDLTLMGEHNQKKINEFSIETVNKNMRDIYEQL